MSADLPLKTIYLRDISGLVRPEDMANVAIAVPMVWSMGLIQLRAMLEDADQAVPPPNVGEFDAQDVALRARLSGIVGRDEAELAALYDATAARLYALALRIVGDRGGAEEVVSDVYVQVWERANRYDSRRGKVMHWLYMICRSRALDHLRRREDPETTPEPETLLTAAESAEGDPGEILMGVQRDSAIRAALETLDNSQRQLIALAFFRDMSHQEIAEQTGIPLGTVKSTLRRSLISLRECLRSSRQALRY